MPNDDEGPAELADLVPAGNCRDTTAITWENFTNQRHQIRPPGATIFNRRQQLQV
jgi:hypothetical protein